MMGIRRALPFVMFIAPLLFPVCLLGQDCSSAVQEKSKLYFRMGGGNEPVYPRGTGRYKRWLTGANLNFPGKKYEGCLQTEIVGAAVFDNPDSFNFSVRFDKINNFKGHKVLFGILHTDAYSLNALPVPDPGARRPTSSVNTTWIELGWRGKRKNLSTETFFRYAVSGKEPLFFGYYTAPYSRENLSVWLKWNFTEKNNLVFNSQIYWNSFSKNRFVERLIFERPLGRHINFETRFNFYANRGFDPEMPAPPFRFFVDRFLRNHWSIQGGFNVPFSVKF